MIAQYLTGTQSTLPEEVQDNVSDTLATDLTLVLFDYVLHNL